MPGTAENPDSEKTSGNEASESVVKDDSVAAVGETENKGMTVDVEFKVDTSLQKTGDTLYMYNTCAVLLPFFFLHE